MEVARENKKIRRNEEAIFPWLKVVRRNLLRSFPEVNAETLQLLHENIHEEFKKILDGKDKCRANIFYRILSYFYLHFCWKIKWNEECLLKSSCVEILYYMSHVGLILSDGDVSSVWSNQILSVLKSFPGDPYMMCDALLLIRNMKHKYHSAYAKILKSVLCDKSMRKPLDAKCFMKTMLLFRRLKFLSNCSKKRKKIFSLASKVKCPSDLENWLSSLNINSLCNIQCGEVIQILLKTKLKYCTIRKLFQVLLGNKYDEKVIKPDRLENVKITQSIADRKLIKKKSNKNLKKKSTMQLHKQEEKCLNNKISRNEQHEENSRKSDQKCTVLDNTLEQNSVVVSIELQNQQTDRASIQSGYQYSNSSEIYSKEIFKTSEHLPSLFDHSSPKTEKRKKRKHLQSEDSILKTSLEDSHALSSNQKNIFNKINYELEESNSKDSEFSLSDNQALTGNQRENMCEKIYEHDSKTVTSENSKSTSHRKKRHYKKNQPKSKQFISESDSVSDEEIVSKLEISEMINNSCGFLKMEQTKLNIDNIESQNISNPKRSSISSSPLMTKVKSFCTPQESVIKQCSYSVTEQTSKNSNNPVNSAKQKRSGKLKLKKFVLESDSNNQRASENNSRNSSCSSKSSKVKHKKFVLGSDSDPSNDQSISNNIQNVLDNFSIHNSKNCHNESFLGIYSKSFPEPTVISGANSDNLSCSTLPKIPRKSPCKAINKRYFESDSSLSDSYVSKNKIQKILNKSDNCKDCFNEKSQTQSGSFMQSSSIFAHCSSVCSSKSTSDKIKKSKRFVESASSSFDDEHVPENNKQMSHSSDDFQNHFSNSSIKIQAEVHRPCSNTNLSHSISSRRLPSKRKQSSNLHALDPELNSCRSSVSNSDNLHMLLNTPERNKKYIDEELSPCSSDPLENLPLSEIQKQIQSDSTNSVNIQEKFVVLSETISDSSVNQTLSDIDKPCNDLITIKRKHENVLRESSVESTSDSSENLSLLAVQKKLKSISDSLAFSQTSGLKLNSNQSLEKNSDDCIQNCNLKVLDSSKNLSISEIQKELKNNSNSSAFKKFQNSVVNFNLEQSLEKHSDDCIQENGKISDEAFPNLNLSVSDLQQGNTLKNFSLKRKKGLSKIQSLLEIDKMISNLVISEKESPEEFLLDSDYSCDNHFLSTITNKLDPNISDADNCLTNSFSDNHLDSSNVHNVFHKHVTDYLNGPLFNINNSPLPTVIPYNKTVNEPIKHKPGFTCNTSNIDTSHINKIKENLSTESKKRYNLQDYVNIHRDIFLNSSLELFQSKGMNDFQQLSTWYQNNNGNLESQSHNLNFEMVAASEDKINKTQNSEISLKHIQHNADISKINSSDQPPFNKLLCPEMSSELKEKSLVNQSKLDTVPETNKKILFICDLEKKMCEVHMLPESLLTFLNKPCNVTDKQTVCPNNSHCNCPVCSSTSVSAGCDNEEQPKSDNNKLNMNAQVEHIFVNGIKISTASLFPVTYLGKRCDEIESTQDHSMEKKSSLLAPGKLHDSKEKRFCSLNSNSENLVTENYHRKKALKRSDLLRNNRSSKPKSARNGTHVPHRSYNLRTRRRTKPYYDCGETTDDF